MAVAKEKALDGSRSIGEIAYAIGFKIPSYFTRHYQRPCGQKANDIGH